MRARPVIAFVLALALALSALPCYAYAGEVDSYGGQDESGTVQVPSSEVQEEESSFSEDSSTGASFSSGSLSSSLQNQNSNSLLTGIQSYAVSGGFSGGSTSGGFSGGGIRLTDDGMANNFRFLLKALGYNVAGNGEVSTNGGGLLGVLIRIGWAIDNIWADTGQISEDVAQSETILRTLSTTLTAISNDLSNDSGSTIDALQGGLSYLSSLPSVSSNLSSGGLSAASWLNRISSQLGTDGALVGRLTSGDMGAASWLNRISSQLNSGGALANRLDSAVSLLSTLGTISSQLGTDGAIVNRLTSALGYLSSDDLGAASWLNRISSQLGTDGALSGRLDVLSDRLSYTPSGSSTLQTAGGMLWQLLSAVRALDIGGVIDGIETGSHSIVDAIESKQIVVELPSFDSSSIVDAINRLIDTVEGLDLSTEAEVTVNVENQKEQGLNLLDSLLGVLDVAAIASSLSTLTSTLEDSFPFGALFMVASALSVLSASPAAPSFSGVVSGVSIDIDLSPFDSVAALCRALLLVLYVIGLYHATRDWVFHSGGGDS